MKRNMSEWVTATIGANRKKPLPILSFPGTQLLGKTVREVINDADLYAQGLKLVADRADMAASVSFMDLSVEAECFGSRIRTSDDEVPTVVGAILEEEEDADALEIPEVGSKRSGVTIEAVRKATGLITDRAVMAGIIGPFSLAGRLMGVSEALVYCLEEPDMVQKTMEKCTKFLIDYAKAFKEAGANGIVMAEPLTGILSPALAKEFSSPWCKKLVDAVQDEAFIVIYHNCGGTVPKMADVISSVGAKAYHFGNVVSMKEMLEKMPQDVLVLGNVDPAGEIRNGTPETVRAATQKLLEECSGHANYIVSTGCDVPPQASWENIDAFMNTVKEFYGKE